MIVLVVLFKVPANLLIMSEQKSIATTRDAQITQAIKVVRGQRVMLDSDLAKLYGVTTAALNQAVGRNAKRFPDDFSFRLTRL